MSRPVQVGDFARVVLGNESQTYPIELIEGNNIYISVAEGESSVLIPLNGEYQVRGLGVNHRVELIPNDTSSLIGLPELDLALLVELDDEDFDVICQVDDYVKELCEGDQIWKDKLINKFGQRTFNYLYRSPKFNAKAYYYLLKDVLSVGGANIAVERIDQPLLDVIESFGYKPDIQEYERGPGEAYRPGSINLLPENFMAFLREAELGPQVAQSYSDKSLPVAIEGTRLNDVLWFIHPTINGQPNPFYRFNFYGRNNSVFDLLVLHLYYSNSKHENSRGHLSNRHPVSSNAIMKKYLSGSFSASNAMRTYLGDVMRTFIDEDVLKIQHQHPERSQQAIEIGEMMKAAINDPTLKVRTFLRMFNPNKFGREDFDRFDRYVRDMTNQERVEITPQVEEALDRVYSIIPGITPDIAFDAISLVVGRVILSAKILWTMNFQ